MSYQSNKIDTQIYNCMDCQRPYTNQMMIIVPEYSMFRICIRCFNKERKNYEYNAKNESMDRRI